MTHCRFWQNSKIQRRSSALAVVWVVALAATFALAAGCNKKAAPATTPSTASAIRVSRNAGSVTIETPEAEFVVAPNGYVSASLLAGQRPLSLDDSGTEPGLLAVVAGKKVQDFAFDPAAARISASW